jgi:iron uptake system component EfeO
MLRTGRCSIALLGCLCLAGCSDSPNDYEGDATLTVRDYVGGQLEKLSKASEALQKAAPEPDADGWNADDDAAAVGDMRKAWGDARAAYERIEGSIVVLFHELDLSTDERYDGFIESDPDAYLFDGQGVTGVHAIERILWSDTIPERVVQFESKLDGYVKAAFPSTESEARDFKTGLCQRLVDDTHEMSSEFKSLGTLDSTTAFRGMIGSMREQSEKTTKAASGEDESRYAQNTLADMRANLAGARAVFEAFRPWIEADTSVTKAKEIASGLDSIEKAYAATSGNALPEVPVGFNPDDPSEDDLATPYGKLWSLLNKQTDPRDATSLVAKMNASADAMRIPGIADQ